MPELNFSNPQGQTLTVTSPDGSIPSEKELDTMFSQKYSSKKETKEGSTDKFETKGSSDMFNLGESTESQVNPKSSGNVFQDIAGDLARGAINSGAATVDKVNGVTKLLKNVTQVDLGSHDLTNVSDKLKQLAEQQPQLSNPIASNVTQFIGSLPVGIAEFAGTGGGVGFIARSAALQAAQEYNKTQSPVDLAKGAIVGGTVGAILERAPNIIEGAAQMAKKWGKTGGKTYLQAVTGATEKEAQQIINNLPKMDINPKSKIQDFNEAKDLSKIEISTLKENNSNLIKLQKEKYTHEYETAKTLSDDAVNNVVENGRDTIDSLRDIKFQRQEDLANTTSANMMAAIDSGTQKLADATLQTTANAVKAKGSLENTVVSIFDTAGKKVSALEKGATDDIINAHATLEKNGLDYVPTDIVKKEIDNVIGTGGKYFKKLGERAEKTLQKDVPLRSGVRLSDLPESVQKQYAQQTNLGQIAKSGNTPESLVAVQGLKTNAVVKSIKLLNETRKGLVEEFEAGGNTSLAALEAHAKALEGAIDKGFSGEAVPKGLVEILARVKSAINATKLYDKHPQELSHLEPLANANKQFSSQIDNLRNSLNLYKDNVDGTVNPQKVFRALENNDSGYLAKLRQADEALPKEDRIFDKVQKAYNDFKTVESSEKIVLSKTEKQISQNRIELTKKFNDMKKQLNNEQRKELSLKIKETRGENRMFSKQEQQKLKDLHLNQEHTLNLLQSQKDSELEILQNSINERLNSLHLLHMARGTRASATGNARIFQNVANYRSIDGLSTLNPLKMLQGSAISKVASPIGASGIVKSALMAPENVQGLKKVAGNVLLKRLLASSLSVNKQEK